MKERPILMTPENAQKVFEGVKTQTRRMVKYIPALGDPNEWCRRANDKDFHALVGDYRRFCPYGEVRGRLWIREAHQFDPPDDGTWGYTQFMGCKDSNISDIPERFRKPQHCLYRGNWSGTPLIWRPSIHMPRWACRSVVELTEIRVEQIGRISERDAQAEGVNSIEEFIELWKSIHETWEPSLWVWVLVFKKLPC